MFRLGRTSAASKIPLRRTVEITPKKSVRVGRNEPCPCGSGRKYKACHETEGEAYLLKLARKQEMDRWEEEQKEAGVSWFRRVLGRALR